MDESTSYWLPRFVFQRGLGLVYLIAFVVVLNQFGPLLGEHGLLPVPLFVKQAAFREAPSLFFFFPNNTAFAIGAWLGLLLACCAVTGVSERYGMWLSVLTWALLWVLYLSFVNAGQIFYGFGWESILLEAGFFAIFTGSARSAPDRIPIWILRWVLFRVMFGAGLIKWRGDPCWRDLSCLDYHYETQPMPNPLSWYLHWAPPWTHRAGVLFNHFVELVVPFGYFAPQPVSTIAGLFTIAFQLLLLSSGNLSWLNLLTIVLAATTLDGRFLSALLRIAPPATNPPHRLRRPVMVGLAAVVAILSVPPIINMLSPGQLMNFNYNPLHLVNTYGAFGSVTRTRNEVIVEGADDAVLTPSTRWREYEFKGKPGDLLRRPPQVAPYHLRLDWLMWFAAMSPYYEHPWFVHFLAKLLQGDEATLGLLRSNPFPQRPPRYVRALRYEYHFTTPTERKETGRWWQRQLVDVYLPPVSLDNPSLRRLLEQEGWM